MTIGHLLNRTLAHRRQVDAEDGAGGTEPTWVDLDPLPCRTSQPSAAERLYASQPQADLTQHVYTDPGADVRKGDVLAEGAVQWRVTATIRPSQAQYLRADCELIQTRGET